MSGGRPRRLRKASELLAKLLRPLAYAALPMMANIISRLVRGNDAYPIFSRNGFYLLRKHYYTPIPEDDDLTDSFWETTSDLVGIDVNQERCIDFIDKHVVPYNAEFGQYPLQGGGEETGFFLLNGRFMAVDGHVYYGLIRSMKPGRILEVGCGISTLLASDAVRKNAQEGSVSELVCVEPYQTALLQSGKLEISELVVKKVQQVALDLFTSLSDGDILFIDTSHVLKAGGDVQFLYCEVLPRLQRGVYVHVHDISLPKPYPRVYFDRNFYFWNEQYVLQTFLTHNAHAEVVWPGNFMMHKHPQWMLKTFPEISTMREQYPSSEPSSFWFRIK